MLGVRRDEVRGQSRVALQGGRVGRRAAVDQLGGWGSHLAMGAGMAWTRQ